MSNIILIGFMGVGKSTISIRLSQLLGMESVEIDAVIVEQVGIPITEIFSEYGEDYFRKLESNIIKGIKEKDNLIVSCGGGAVLHNDNIKNLKKGGYIVLLTASPTTIYERVRLSGDRPILNGNMSVEYISEVMEKRKPQYMYAADVVINTELKTVDEICEEIIRYVNEQSDMN